LLPRGSKSKQWFAGKNMADVAAGRTHYTVVIGSEMKQQMMVSIQHWLTAEVIKMSCFTKAHL
jgi:hypothetical protein